VSLGTVCGAIGVAGRDGAGSLATGGRGDGAGCGLDGDCAESGSVVSDINSHVLIEIFFTSVSSQEAEVTVPLEAR
jgi:hypothetical protein